MTREKYLMESFLNYIRSNNKDYKNKKILFFGLMLPNKFLYSYLKYQGYNCIGFLDNDKKKVEKYNQYLGDYIEISNISNVGNAYLPEELSNIDDYEVFIISRHYLQMKSQLMVGLNMNESCIHKLAKVEEYEKLPIATFEELKSYLGTMFDNYLFYNKIETIIQLSDAGFFLKEDMEEEILLKNNDCSIWVNPLYHGIANEIFIEKIYDVVNDYIDKRKRYVVLDVGGNRGYAAVWFASQLWCDKVYTYEIIPQNNECILKNIHENPQYNIISKPYGLGNQDKKVDVYYFPLRDAISSIKSEFLEQYAPGQINNAEVISVDIRKTSDCFRTLEKETFIIKIDVEGSEYEILEDISKNYPDFFHNVELIIGDAHMGLQRLTDILEKHNFVLQEEFYTNQAVAPFLYKREEKNV